MKRLRNRLYLIDAIGLFSPYGRVVLACVDEKWYVCEGDYWGFDYRDGENLQEVSYDMYDLMRFSDLPGVCPDLPEVVDDIRKRCESGNFKGSPWRHFSEFDGISADEIRKRKDVYDMVMIGVEKSWYVMNGNNDIVSQRFPEDEAYKGVFVPFNEFQAKKWFTEHYTREEAEREGYRLCLVSEDDRTWVEILEQYSFNDIFPQS